MSSMADTINDALAAIGGSTESSLRTIIADFGALSLSVEDRLSVLATVIANAATVHHTGHTSAYLNAVRIWSVEIAGAVQPSPPRFDGMEPDEAAVDDAAEMLIAGLDGLVQAMSDAGVRVQDRLVAELALVARLLGQHDANTIHFMLMAVRNVLSHGGYRAGDRVDVPLYEMTRPLTRNAPLASTLPRGLA